MSMKRRYLIYLVLPLVLVAVAAGWWLKPAGFNRAEAALAEFSVEKLSCGSCVQKINEALQPVAGIGTIEVSVTSGRSRVEFDPSRTSSAEIGRLITEAGYPARLRTELSPAEYAGLRQEQTRLGAKYVARVGSRLVARDDFEQALKLRLGDREASPALLEQLRRQLWEELQQREILLAAAESSGVVVQPGEVDVRLEKLRQGHDDLDQLVTRRFGSMEAFRRQLRNDMTIEKLMATKVPADISDPAQRQLRLQQWYGDLVQRTEVVIFDPQLKRVTAGGGDCGSGGGGGCCG